MEKKELEENSRIEVFGDLFFAEFDLIANEVLLIPMGKY